MTVSVSNEIFSIREVFEPLSSGKSSVLEEIATPRKGSRAWNRMVAQGLISE